MMSSLTFREASQSDPLLIAEPPFKGAIPHLLSPAVQALATDNDH